MVPVTAIFFGLFALLAVYAALMVVLQRNPIASALHLVLVFLSLGGLFVLLQAPFLAAVQVIVYAGAIMVLFLFVIMLLNLQRDVDDGLHHKTRRIFGWLLGIALAAQGYLVLRQPWAIGPLGNEPAGLVAQVGNTQSLARRLFEDYLLPFEATSFILLVAILGVVVLARKPGRSAGVEEAP
jgi:NADH-quinone oxidoreductase subunit J